MNFCFSFILIFSFMLLSCESSTSTFPNGKNENSGQEEPLSGEKSTAIQLNGSEKWPVNEEMKPAIQKMEDVLEVFNNSGQKDYHLLANNLQKNNDLLISNCTMKGQGHEELHKWLIPHLKLIKQLAGETDPDKQDQLVQQIQISMETYKNYFQ